MITGTVPGPASQDMLFSRELNPRFSSRYHAEQGYWYFDTLDTYAPRISSPDYASHVIRWEWPPWLFLTGHKDHWMALDRLLVLYPTEITKRECKGFLIQPFSRCRVTFHYKWIDSHVEIYEEFTFNDAGEITFIEAWSDKNGYRPMDARTDYWAEGDNVARLSTRVPGLGRPDGRYQLRQIGQLARSDKDLKGLQKRLKMPVIAWIQEGIRFVVSPEKHNGGERPRPVGWHAAIQ